ncbi:titin-like isoform X2 [Anthonomus grandis grandis]|uniref:titin-like isoform X2 n=1 Tax=Anthonomus grandis grandis TaxID=2921223 RepID=UPI0021652E14|nr:titin-like isoform X2 [Anthonomus grandis grandis]
MGKRARKTRWRALDIADEHSDSEESNTNSSAVSSRYSRVSNSTGYYSSKYSYSSQSTPARRRYNQYDGSIKSTRSSSTTSETKITFNEDEYTRITTPRQDVLFKKGYLNKPKTYQTQTSTGNSTISTGNSTENGTPDHQSTDLDYESQFMFPNGFVDQNGIYYVNSYEPYPLMLFNPPTYYHEFSNTKAKRYSTGSLSESMSPNNEEATSQDMSQSGGEASNSGVSDYSGPPIFNMVYPGYYVNGACTPTGMANGPHHQYPPEPVKKLKKRRERKSSKTIPGDSSEFTDDNSADEQSDKTTHLHRVRIPEDQPPEAPPCSVETTSEKPSSGDSTTTGCADQKTETNLDQTQPDHKKPPSVLKPDAEEFIPRAYHHQQALGAPLKMLPPNFMPIPIVPIPGPPHPAFIPPGFPINFIPPKIYPTAAPTFTPPIVQESQCEDNESKIEESTATPSHTPVVEENKPHSKAIDIATIVSKLNAVRQEQQENPPKDVEERVQKPQVFKRNFYNRYRGSVQAQESPRHKPREAAEGFQRKPWKSQSNKLESPQKHHNNTKKFHVKEEQVKPKPSPSQWISVSSRKKKKNKPTEDPEEIDNNNVEEEILSSVETTELFESYDVSLLVDVVPPSQLAQKDEEQEEEKRIENILSSIAQKEVITNGKVTPPDIKEVSEIEKEIIVKIEESDQIEKSLVEEVTTEECKPKKRSKKGTQKPLTKKVIITDIFEEPPEEPVKQTVKKPLKPAETPKEPTPEPEKKTKKKKKKKPSLAPMNDSGDNLEVFLASEEDKTTDDISLELDKLIQKGMFSSLQSNIQESDEFFMSFPSSTKTPDYNRIFQSTRQFLKPNMVSVEHDIKVDSLYKGHIKSHSSTVDTADPTAGPHLSLQPQEVPSSCPETPPAVDHDDVAKLVEEVIVEQCDGAQLPSITLAVKEWMCKTRETTPDVEILKSPEEIQKYLEEEEEEEDTLFDDEKDDLLEFWDNLNCDDNILQKDNSVKSVKDDAEMKCCTDKIKLENNEEVKVYDGKNETSKFLDEENDAQKKEEKLPHRTRACCILQ